MGWKGHQQLDADNFLPQRLHYASPEQLNHFPTATAFRVTEQLASAPMAPSLPI
jgi:hypothetical protein